MTLPPEYLEQIQRYYPDLERIRLEVNRDGLVNDVVIANQERVFRFPKDEWAREMLTREARVLELVRRYVTVPVPQYERLELGFVTYRLIPGRAPHQGEILSLPDNVQQNLAEGLATFLRQLHTIPAVEFERSGIPASGAVRNRQDWIELYESARTDLYPYLMAYAREWVESLYAPLLDGRLDLNYRPVLTHGDLGPYEVLVDPQTFAVNGVLDFGTAGLGDPANDFAAIINALGESFLHRMISVYPDIDAALDRARFWVGTLEIQWALGGLRTKDPSWFFVHLGRARDVLPFGMRL